MQRHVPCRAVDELGQHGREDQETLRIAHSDDETLPDDAPHVRGWPLLRVRDGRFPAEANRCTSPISAISTAARVVPMPDNCGHPAGPACVGTFVADAESG